MLEVRTLGCFDVRLDGRPVEIPSRPAQSLLAYLVITGGTSHRRERLAGMLWPESKERNARNNLRHVLWRLRRTVGERYFKTDGLMVSFDTAQPYWLDAERLQTGADDRPLEQVLEDLRVYGGELLPGFYDDWVVLERERLRAIFERRMQKALDRLMERARWSEVMEWAERWIALGQVPEPAYRALMHAYAGQGDLAGLAAAFERCETALRNELGVEPSEPTRRTFEMLSRGDPPGVGTRPLGRVNEAWTATALRAMLEEWCRRGVETLDLASLSIIHAAPPGLTFETKHAALLIRSALEHEVDLQPWLERAQSPEEATAILQQALAANPRPQIRRRIVHALEGLPGERSLEALARVAASDEDLSVRAIAALAAARRGRHAPVMRDLRDAMLHKGDSMAFDAFVVVADELGIPAGIGTYPKVRVALNLGRRRWRAHRDRVLQATWRGALGVGLAMAVFGSMTPLLVALAMPDEFQAQLRFVSVSAWSFSGAMAGLVIGALQGSVSSFAVNLAESLWRGWLRERMRLVCGTLAGLAYGLHLIVFSLLGLLSPRATPSVYIPLDLLYGLVVGFGLALLVPPWDIERARGSLPIRLALAISILVLATVPYVYWVYLGLAAETLPSRIGLVTFLCLGMVLAFRKSWARAGGLGPQADARRSVAAPGSRRYGEGRR